MVFIKNIAIYSTIIPIILLLFNNYTILKIKYNIKNAIKS